MSVYPADRVTLREVGLRDGLQLAKALPSTEAKRAWLAAEAKAGVRHFEVGSFLPAARFPQFADVDEMIAAAEALDVHSAALTLNDAGDLGVRLVGTDGTAGFAPVTLIRDTPRGVWLGGLPHDADVIVIGQEYVTDGVPVAATFVEADQ